MKKINRIPYQISPMNQTTFHLVTENEKAKSSFGRLWRTSY